MGTQASFSRQREYASPGSVGNLPRRAGQRRCVQLSMGGWFTTEGAEGTKPWGLAEPLGLQGGGAGTADVEQLTKLLAP